MMIMKIQLIIIKGHRRSIRTDCKNALIFMFASEAGGEGSEIFPNARVCPTAGDAVPKFGFGAKPRSGRKRVSDRIAKPFATMTIDSRSGNIAKPIIFGYKLVLS